MTYNNVQDSKSGTSNLSGIVLDPRSSNQSSLNKTSFLDVGQKTWRKIIPVSGSSISNTGTTTSRFNINGTGVFLKNSFYLVLKNVVLANSDGTNNVTFAKGHVASCISSIKVIMNNVLISETRNFGLLSVKKMKYERSSDHLAQEQSVIGYYAGASSNQTGETHDYMAHMYSDDILNQSIPLNSFKDNGFIIEIQFESNPDKYLSTTTGTGTLSMTCQPEVRFQEDNSPLNLGALTSTWSIPFTSYINSQTSVSSGATTASVKLPSFQDGRLNSYESYLLHDNDIDVKTNHLKLWNEQKNNLSSVVIKHGNKSIFVDSDLSSDPDFWRSTYDVHGWVDNLVTNWLTTNSKLDGDWSCAFTLTTHGLVGGLSKNVNMDVRYTFSGGASEALTIYAWFKVSHVLHVSPDGTVKFVSI